MAVMEINGKQLRTKTELKREAQEMLMHGIGNVLGYWQETSTGPGLGTPTEDEIAEFSRILYEQADRVAKMFGYDEAWSN